MKIKTWTACVALALVMACTAQQRAKGETTSWQNASGVVFEDATNWDNGVPEADDNAFFGFLPGVVSSYPVILAMDHAFNSMQVSAHVVQMELDGNTLTLTDPELNIPAIGSFIVGFSSSDAELHIINGNFNANLALVNPSSSADATLRIGSGASWTSGRFTVLGSGGGSGNVVVEAGGLMTVPQMNIHNSTGSASLTVTGAGSQFTSSLTELNAGTITITSSGIAHLGGLSGGGGGTTALNIDSTAGDVTIGNDSGGGTSFSGTFTGSGFARKVGNSWQTFWNGAGVRLSSVEGGILELSGGSLVTPNAAFDIDAVVAGQWAQLWLDNAASMAAQTVRIGVNADRTGKLSIEGGSTISASSGNIAQMTGSNGILEVDGAGSTWTSTGSLSAGYSGNGMLTITGGGGVSNTTGYVGREAGSTGAVTVDGDGSSWTNSEGMHIGSEGNGTLNISGGGSVVNTTGRVGNASGATGTVTVDGTGSSWTMTGELRVGDLGAGTLNIENGGSVANTSGRIGAQGASTGAVTVDGAGSIWSNTSDLSVGYDGNGTLTIQNGGTVSIANIANAFIGRQGGAVGVATIDGIGTMWTMNDDLYVGYSGDGEMVVQNGGSVSSRTGLIARLSGSMGAVTVDGTGSSWDITEILSVGRVDEGTLTISGGGAVSNEYAYIAEENGSIGAVTVEGLGSTWTSAAGLRVGFRGAGELLIQGGGSVANTLNGIIGSQTGSVGTATVDGAGSTWTMTDELRIGDNGSGTLLITDGGSVSNINGTLGRHSGSTGTATVNGVGSNWTMSGELSIGGDAFSTNAVGGTGSLSITDGGSVSNTNARIGDRNGSTGTVSVTGAGSTWTNTGILLIGGAGNANGTLTIQNGGTVSNTFTALLGDGTSSTGTVTVDGAGSVWNNSDMLDVGRRSNGTLIIQNGGHVSNSSGRLGVDSGSTGTATVTGAGSTWTNTDSLYIGGSATTAGGAGTLTVGSGALGPQDGTDGLVQVDDMLHIYPGNTVYLRGGTIEARSLIVPDANFDDNWTSGTVRITFPSLLIGENGGSGVGPFGYNLTVGANMRLEIDDGFSQGVLAVIAQFGGSATLTVNQGGVVSAPRTQLTIGRDSTVTVDNGTLELLHMGSLTSGATFNFSSGTVHFTGSMELRPGDGLNALKSLTPGKTVQVDTLYLRDALILNGGKLAIRSLVLDGGELLWDRGELELAGTSNIDLIVPSFGVLTGGGTINGTVTGLTGSTIAATGSLTLGSSSQVNGFYSNGTLEVGPGATLTLADANDAVLDSGAWAALDDGTLAAANGLTLDFGGNITGHGAVDTPDDPARPFTNNGHVTGNSLSEPITLTGYVKGVGTLDNVVITGTDAPGFSPATVNRGSVQYDGVLEIEIGGTAPGSFDQLNHILGAGIADLGGVLDVSLINGFTPTVDDTFEILTAIGGVNGMFDTLAEELPTLAGNLAWQINYGANTVVLAVVSAGLTGDFNQDGTVDAADYVLWRKTIGTQPDYDDWRGNFGATASGAAAGAQSSTTAVPEPAGLALLLCAVGLFLVPRGRCRVSAEPSAVSFQPSVTDG